MTIIANKLAAPNVTKCPDRVAHDLSRYDAPNCYAAIDSMIEDSKGDMWECLEELADELCISDHHVSWSDCYE